MCDGIANGDESEPVNEGKAIGGVGADHSIICDRIWEKVHCRAHNDFYV